MTPETFIARWKDNALTERAGAQAHFDDLCDLLGVEKPRDPDHYCFERGAKKSGGGDGWADVWKRGCFGWENKKPGRDLNAALKQLTDYALELENPPLLVVSDRERIEIHTAFTGYPDEPRLILLQDIGQPENLQILRWVFTDPEKLKPTKSLAAITEEAAGKFGSLAEALRERGNPPDQVAHFLTQCLFCMFAEDENLLPRGIFTNLLDKAVDIDRA
ncbi:MAG: type IIL restriction-modification enzyme MmeI, partial [Fluviibacter sp.]